VGQNRPFVAGVTHHYPGWATMAKPSGGTRRGAVDLTHRRSLGGPTGGVSQCVNLLATVAPVGGKRCLVGGVAGLSRPTGCRRNVGLAGGFLGREFRPRQRGGDAVGATKRGKGTKWMVVVDGQGLPLGSQLTAATPAEVTLAEGTLDAIQTEARPERIIADKAYDSDPFRQALADRGLELICPHRRNRRKAKTQDGRKLRRYRRRWKIERTFAWLGNFRRLVVRYERHLLMYAAFFHLACCLILVRWL
jgi:transposase